MKQVIVRIGLVAGAALILAAGSADARPIHRREARQEARIAEGVDSGKLSGAEAQRLGRQEATIAKEEQAMRDANGGRLTVPERRALTRQQNHLSHRIYRQKHDGNAR
jgi:hypothetical protein